MNVGVLPRPPRFLRHAEVLALHEAAINEFGGSLGVRDPGLLDAALNMPRQSFGGQFAHEIPFGMAAAYAFHICKNHPFLDGNKRAALSSMVVFLHMNGWELEVDDLDAADKILGVAEGAVSKETLVAWLAEVARPLPSIELRDFIRSLDYARVIAAFEAFGTESGEEGSRAMAGAAAVIPAVYQVTAGIRAAEAAGDARAAAILKQHAMLLTALWRIAEDMGYEW